MIKASITDIRKRLRGLQYSPNEYRSNSVFIESAIKIANGGRSTDIIRTIESATKSQNNLPFNVCLELFDSLTRCGTKNEIEKMGNVITEDFVHRVRDANEMMKVIKRRITVATNKIKQKETDNVFDAVTDSLPKPVSPTVENTVISIYEKILNKAELYSHCDRVIENYNRISKRFNLDKLFYENTRYNGVKDTVILLCNNIDTYSTPNDIKFNTVIETAYYGFENNNVEYKKSDILEAAIDFFLFKKDGLQSCKEVLENTVFFDKDEDMGNIDIITEEEPEQITSESVDISIENYCTTPSLYKQTVLTETKEFKELFKKFKEEELPKESKPESKLRKLINTLYSKDVDSIVEGTPDLLAWIRTFFIVGSCAIPFVGPVLMVVGFIANKFISLEMDKKNVSKMVKCFENEIERSKKKLETIENSEDKQKLEKYIKSLKDAKDKVNTYYLNLLSEEELEAQYNDMSFDGFDFGIEDDIDDDFEGLIESNIYTNMAEAVETYIELNKSHPLDDFEIKNLVYKLNDSDIISIAQISAQYSDVFNTPVYNNAIDSKISDIKKEKIRYDSIVDKVYAISALDKAKKAIQGTERVSLENNVTIFEAYENLSLINEAHSAINMIIDTNGENSYLLEASISNKLKMASMKLRSTLTKLSDKEKQVSQSVDLGLNNFTKGVERALTNDNREAIIKGSILPSASKVIKLAIVNAGLVAIGQPVLALIATLGYLGTSARFKAKERQMLIDEIEIELKMCQKYIDIAESKNDMKALKQLLMIQRDLQRQHQRIKYKMKVQFGQKVYDTKSSEIE